MLLSRERSRVYILKIQDGRRKRVSTFIVCKINVYVSFFLSIALCFSVCYRYDYTNNVYLVTPKIEKAPLIELLDKYSDYEYQV